MSSQLRADQDFDVLLDDDRAGEAGMFAGSGAVEAGCKAVAGQRLKLSGMR